MSGPKCKAIVYGHTKREEEALQLEDSLFIFSKWDTDREKHRQDY